MTDDTTVFRNVGQALHRAYLMAVTEGMPAPQMNWLEDFKEQRYGRSAKGWSTGLSREEIRQQCVNVRDTVDRKLTETERYSVWARFAYQTLRADGVRGLRDHFASFCSTANPSAVLALLWASYDPQKAGRRKERSRRPAGALGRVEEETWSTRLIERDFGCSRATLRRDQKVLRKLCGDLEATALGKLETIFIESGLIPDEN